jgi:RNA polymerase sigma-70 factor (ECF subfamily)
MPPREIGRGELRFSSPIPEKRSGPTEENGAVARLITVTRGRAAAAEPAGLVEACRQGDREAFRALYEAYKDDVYSIAWNFTGDEETARDVAQDVFLKLFSAIGGFRGESSFRTWLFRLVANACRDAQRRSRRLVPLEGVLEKAEDPGSSDADARDREISRRVRSAVVSLAPKIRLAILLRYVEELSYSEIAAALRCSPGTVASRLNRGHRMLAERLLALRGTV